MKVLDLFCGAGGMSQGFEDAGFKVIGGIDFDKHALETHEFNFPDAINICGDIRQITNENITEMFDHNVDVIIGGPPCQGFSAANKWDTEEEKVEKNVLFFEYLRFVQVLKPKVFVIENVRQLLTKDNGYAKDEIERITSKYGYSVTSSILNSSDYGVPQNRVRAFIIGVRNDLDKEFDFTEILKSDEKNNVFDAISDFYSLEQDFLNNQKIQDRHISEPMSEFQATMRKKTTKIYNHDIRYSNSTVQERMSFVPQGGNWRNVPEHLWETQRSNRHSSAYRRLDEKVPSITIDTGHMNYFHPLFNRVPTVRESARIQSFPDHFIFKGTKGAQFRQVGNAVPPLLAKQIAKTIIQILEVNND